MKIKNLLLFIFIAFIPIIIFRDFTPNNELRYLNIANEALANGNFFSFYDHGIPYADKPPLYFWIIMLGKFIFGEHLMGFISLFSVLPAIAIAVIMNKWVKDEVSLEDRKGAILLMFTSAFFLGTAVVLRMDMLMTMFIVLSLDSFYKSYILKKKMEEKNDISIQKQINKHRFLLPLYIFLGIFTKGPVGIMAPILTICVFLAFENQNLKILLKNICYFLGWRAWSVLVIMCILWFTAVWIDGTSEYLSNLLFNQTVNRAIDSFHHKEPFWYYGIAYWYAFFPWSIFIISVIISSYRAKIKHSTLERLMICMTGSFFVIMSLVSSKIVIYLLPIYPFLIYYTFLRLKNVKVNWAIKTGVIFPAITLSLPLIAVVALPIIGIDKLLFIKEILPQDEESFFHEWIVLFISTSIMAGCSIISLIKLKENLSKSVRIIAYGFLFFVFGASTLLPKYNHLVGLSKSVDKALELSTPENLYFYDFRAGSSIDAYIKQFMEKSGKYDQEIINNYGIDELDKEWIQSHIYWRKENSVKEYNSILFIEVKDLEEDLLLVEATKDYPITKYGNYAIIQIP